MFCLELAISCFCTRFIVFAAKVSASDVAKNNAKTVNTGNSGTAGVGVGVKEIMVFTVSLTYF